MLSRTIEEWFGVGDKNHRPLVKGYICKAKEVVIKGEDPVPRSHGRTRGFSYLLIARRRAEGVAGVEEVLPRIQEALGSQTT